MPMWYRVLAIGVSFNLGMLFAIWFLLPPVCENYYSDEPKSVEEPCKDIYYDGDFHNKVVCPHEDHELRSDAESKMVFCRCEEWLP